MTLVRGEEEVKNWGGFRSYLGVSHLSGSGAIVIVRLRLVNLCVRAGRLGRREGLMDSWGPKDRGESTEFAVNWGKVHFQSLSPACPFFPAALLRGLSKAHR